MHQLSIYVMFVWVFFVVLHVVKACLKESHLDLSGLHAFSSCTLD